MTRPLLWKALLALSAGANVALGAFIVWHAGDADDEAVAPAPGDSVPCVLATLGLDPAQKSAIDRIRADFGKDHDARHAELRALREQLFQALERSPGDRTEVDAALAKLGAAQLELRRGLVDQILGITAALRPDQRTKFLGGMHARFVEGSHRREAEAAEETCAAAGPGAETEGAAP